MLVLLWLALLLIAESDSSAPSLAPSARKYGCQLLPVLKHFPSRLYPEECSLTVPFFVCAGFCESSVEPHRAKKKAQNDVYEIQFREDCKCCTPVPRSVQPAEIKEWKLNCTGGIQRNETVNLRMVGECSCTQCRDSVRVG